MSATIQSPEHRRECEIATAAVRRAADVCRRLQAGLVAEDARRKADRSPVTAADYASQALICASLEEAYPGDPIVGEESPAALREDTELRNRVVSLVDAALEGPVGEERVLAWIDRGSGERPARGRFWTVDPIDGTKGFLRGQQYAVALALIEGDGVEVGVLGCPRLELDGTTGLIVRAVRGSGTEWLPLDGDGASQRAFTRRTDDFGELRLVESVDRSHSNHEATRRIAERLGVRSPSLRLDSQVKYAAVAIGLADVFLRLPARASWREWIWDHAAGALVVEEAGGTVSDARGRPFDFGSGRWLSDCRGVVATPADLHQAVVAAAADEVARRLA